MNTFTPGPWFYTPEDGRLPDIYSNGAEGKWNVASANALRDEWEANAHLIAAAPELYAALEHVEIRLTHLAQDSVHVVDALKAVRAALAKARGES